MRPINAPIGVVVALILAGMLLSPASPARAAQFEFGLTHADAVSSNHNVLAGKFAELVGKYSDGRIKITVYPGGQLGNYKTVVEGMQIGTHDLTRNLDVIEPLVPEAAAFNLPYIFPDRKRFERVIGDPVVEKVLDKFKAKGIVIVAWWENGFRHMTNSARPIRKPEDLKGLKMRG